jgi:hypothetical protein
MRRQGTAGGLIPFLLHFMKTPAEGAATSIHLASAADLERVTGRYCVNCKAKSSCERSYDAAAAARLCKSVPTWSACRGCLNTATNRRART